MKTLLTLLLLLVFIACGCSTTAKTTKTTKTTETTEATEAPVPLNQALITAKTKFAAKCPYCGCLCTSQTTQMFGGRSFQDGSGGTIQDWTITFKCRDCDMPFNDYREQLLPKIDSIRLPTNAKEHAKEHTHELVR